MSVIVGFLDNKPIDDYHAKIYRSDGTWVEAVCHPGFVPVRNVTTKIVALCDYCGTPIAGESHCRSCGAPNQRRLLWKSR